MVDAPVTNKPKFQWLHTSHTASLIFQPCSNLKTPVSWARAFHTLSPCPFHLENLLSSYGSCINVNSLGEVSQTSQVLVVTYLIVGKYRKSSINVSLRQSRNKGPLFFSHGLDLPLFLVSLPACYPVPKSLSTECSDDLFYLTHNSHGF